MGRPGRQRGWVGGRAAASWVLRPNDHAMETVTCAPYAGAVRRLRAFFRVKVGVRGAAVEAARPPEWCRVSPARNARGWAAAGGGLGVLRVGGAFVQYAQPLASGSRPSWSRAAQGGSLGADVVPMACVPCASTTRAQTGPGFAARTHRLRSRRRQVSTALTFMSPTSERPTGIVGMPRFVSGARGRCAFDVSTMDTRALPGLVPRSTVPLGQSTRPGFPSERVSQKS